MEVHTVQLVRREGHVCVLIQFSVRQHRHVCAKRLNRRRPVAPLGGRRAKRVEFIAVLTAECGPAVSGAITQRGPALSRAVTQR